MVKITVIKFSASWCAQCKVLKPIFDKVAERHPELEFKEVDVDEDETLTEQFGVRSLPTVVITDNAGTDRKITGVQQEGDLEEFITASADYIREHGSEVED